MVQKDTTISTSKPKTGRQKTKRLICFIVIIAVIAKIVTVLPGLVLIYNEVFDDDPTKEEIFVYVNDNYELLEKFPYEESLSKKNWIAKIYTQRHLGKDTIVDYVYAHNDNIMEFSCGGSGLVTGSTYEGFYFSRDDMPFAMDFYYYHGVRFKKNDEGVYEWHNLDRTHRIYTEKIRDNWYYYIEDFY